MVIANLILKKGEAKTEHFKKFQLKPNRYIFTLQLRFQKILNEDVVDFLMKIGSLSECRSGKLNHP